MRELEQAGLAIAEPHDVLDVMSASDGKVVLPEQHYEILLVVGMIVSGVILIVGSPSYS